MKLTMNQLAFCALFAALTAACSQIIIPLPFTLIPINLATFSVLLSGILLPPRLAILSQLVYLLLGAVGAPVFTQFSGGLGILFGSTGGYIFGYIPAALICSLLCRYFQYRSFFCILSMGAGILTCYLFGTLWYAFLTETEIWASLPICVLPFLPGDALKIVLAAFLGLRIRRIYPPIRAL